MVQKSFYLDTCIWLNLFKKEGDSTKGVPWWKIAKDFIVKVKEDNNQIIVSTIILKELYFKAKSKFKMIKKFFEDEEYIKIIKTIPEDYEFARKIEREDMFRISFYDYLHIALSKRLNTLLVTRDKELIDVGGRMISISKPEDLIS